MAKFQQNPSSRWFDVMKMRAGRDRQMSMLHIGIAVGRPVNTFSELSDFEAEMAIEYFESREKGELAHG